MEIIMNLKSSRLTNKSLGEFDTEAWMDEADALLAAAIATRELWAESRPIILDSIKSKDVDYKKSWNLDKGLPQASVLLIGYACEIFLKAGLVKVYMGCDESRFKYDVKFKFGHNLLFAAQELSFPIDQKVQNNLEFLKRMITNNARYPVVSKGTTEYCDALNLRNREIRNKDKFDSLIYLSEMVREHVARIDSDKENSASFIRTNIDEDGYLMIRSGGHLPTRITYRISSLQKMNKETSLEDIINLFKADDQFTWLSSLWEKVAIYEDCYDGDSTKARKKRTFEVSNSFE